MMVLWAGMARAQDKVYFLDGTSKSCKVTTINSDYIYVEVKGAEEAIPRSMILLLQFSNGSVEVINEPTENASFTPENSNTYNLAERGKYLRDKYKTNYLSVNSLALCNADFSVFYEYTLKNKLFGVGAMGAYNFNTESTWQNFHFFMFSNSKKNFDAGIFANIYPFESTDLMQVYLGVMLKYTEFSFDRTKIDTINTSGIKTVNISYSPARGSQLAPIFLIGTNSFIDENFFIRTMAGLGAYKLNGDYRFEYNYQANRGSSGQTVNRTLLPKFYFGINLGYNF